MTAASSATAAAPQIHKYSETCQTPRCAGDRKLIECCKKTIAGGNHPIAAVIVNLWDGTARTLFTKHFWANLPKLGENTEQPVMFIQRRQPHERTNTANGVEEYEVRTGNTVIETRPLSQLAADTAALAKGKNPGGPDKKANQ